MSLIESIELTFNSSLYKWSKLNKQKKNNTAHLYDCDPPNQNRFKPEFVNKLNWWNQLRFVLFKEHSMNIYVQKKIQMYGTTAEAWTSFQVAQKLHPVGHDEVQHDRGCCKT